MFFQACYLILTELEDIYEEEKLNFNSTAETANQPKSIGCDTIVNLPSSN
jgi:hypothetical protein